MRIDDEMLMAYADSELDEIRRGRVEKALEGDSGLRRRLEAQRALHHRLSSYYDPALDEPVPERLRAMLETNVVPLSPARPAAWRGYAAIAATLVVGLFAGQMLPLAPSGPVAVEEGRMVARGGLARALDRQLASSPEPGAETRIGVSFAATDGRLCRSFETPALSGLACRDGGDWQLVATAPGAGAAAGEYRQAGTGTALVMQAAQEMMAGEPLRPEEEQAARERGWRPR